MRTAFDPQVSLRESAEPRRLDPASSVQLFEGRFEAAYTSDLYIMLSVADATASPQSGKEFVRVLLHDQVPDVL